jgi:hypothetical protein
MVKWDTQEDAVTVHRVVQQIIRTRLPAAERKQWIAVSLRLLDLA